MSQFNLLPQVIIEAGPMCGVYTVMPSLLNGCHVPIGVPLNVLKPWIVTDNSESKLFRPHSHCPDCWGEDSVLKDGAARCASHLCPSDKEMLVCTPMVCGSS